MKRLAPGFVAVVLDALGIEYEERGDELWSRCPNPEHKDNKPSWSINERTGAHHCFSCGFKGGLQFLATTVRGGKVDLTDLADDPAPVDDDYRVSREMTFPEWNPEVHSTAISESELMMFDEPPEWALRERRIDSFSASVYEVKWDSVRGAWILPLREPKPRSGASRPRLLGWQVKAQKGRLFRNYPVGIRKSSTLFGLESVSKDSVVLVESPLDAVLLFSLGYDAVASCGARLSDVQVELLGEFSRVILALDNDDAGRKETERLRRLPDVYLPYKRFPYKVGGPKDVGDMDLDDIREALEEL